MKLATLRDGSRDGRLLVVRRDGEAAAPARRTDAASARSTTGTPPSRSCARSPTSSTAAQLDGMPVDPLRLARAAAARLRVGRRLGVPQPRHPRPQGARRRAADDARDRSARSTRAAPASCSGRAIRSSCAMPAWGLDFESRGLRHPRRHAASARRAADAQHVRAARDARQRLHAAQPRPRRAREGLRLLPEQAGDRVLAVRGHARRARRRVARRPRAPPRAHDLQRQRRRRLRRRPRDALLVLRSRSSTSRRRAGSPPARSSAAARCRTPIARAASRASPSAG